MRNPAENFKARSKTMAAGTRSSSSRSDREAFLRDRATNAAPRHVGSVEGALERVREHRSAIRSIIVDVREIGDRQFGVRPEAGDDERTASEREVPSGLVSQLILEQQLLEGDLKELAHLVDRLKEL